MSDEQEQVEEAVEPLEPLDPRVFRSVDSFFRAVAEGLMSPFEFRVNLRRLGVSLQPDDQVYGPQQYEMADAPTLQEPVPQPPAVLGPPPRPRRPAWDTELDDQE